MAQQIGLAVAILGEALSRGFGRVENLVEKRLKFSQLSLLDSFIG
jgi:hypothetical protein